MLQTIRRAWGVPELRKKILFTLLVLLIYRIGSAIMVPYVDTAVLGDYMNAVGDTILGLYNVMSGGAFAQATVFALGIQPYINSSGSASKTMISPSCSSPSPRISFAASVSTFFWIYRFSGRAP